MQPNGNAATSATATAPSRDARLLELLERVDARLGRLEERLSALEATAELGARATSMFPSTLAMATDVFDGAVARMERRGVDFDARLRASLRLLEQLTSPDMTRAIEGLLASGILEARTLATLGHVATALAALDADAAKPASLWSALRASGDADIQRALGFVLSVARGLGRALAAEPLPELPAARLNERGELR